MVRLLDLLFSSVLIVIFSPILIVTMIILRFTGEREVFYLQERVGYRGRPFNVIKFATMLKESPNLEGGYLTQKNDPRVLPVGRVLRKWKINELPQLFNVWNGTMSLVGPRPQARVHYELYSPDQKAAIDRQIPGVTGLGSLVFRDEEGLLERSGMAFDEFHDGVIAPFKGELERWYSEHRSIGLYFKIILLTALSVIWPHAGYLRFFSGAPRPDSPLRELLTPEQWGGTPAEARIAARDP